VNWPSLQRQFPTVPATVTTLLPQATPQYDISSRFEKLLRVGVVNELSEYLRQNEIHNTRTTSNIGYIKYGDWNEKKTS
jgi:hypothetical protein